MSNPFKKKPTIKETRQQKRKWSTTIVNEDGTKSEVYTKHHCAKLAHELHDAFPHTYPSVNYNKIYTKGFMKGGVRLAQKQANLIVRDGLIHNAPNLYRKVVEYIRYYYLMYKKTLKPRIKNVRDNMVFSYHYWRFTFLIRFNIKKNKFKSWLKNLFK